MNILIPHHWLLDHLQTEATPLEIQKCLSLAGPSVERIYDRAGESVYDIEVTTNRVDVMSVRGLAREAAIILTQAGLASKLKPLAVYQEPRSTKHQPLPKISQDPTLSQRVTCVLLTNCHRAPTPNWMATRLTQVEQNIHDAVIDITNYVTHDLGHPCHAFDYDKLIKTGGKIIIAEAQPGEQFTTLDGNSFTTVGGEVVFRDGKGEIIDLPSIKGTANTSVDDSTTNILLLMESIRPDKVRLASMTHQIRTVAAQLMEKGVDPHLMDEVMQSAIHLYTSICQAKVGSPIYNDFPNPVKPPTITLTPQFIMRYLGLSLPLATITTILESLGCQVQVTDQPTLEVTPPTFRPDLQIPVDLVEEIARIYGYHQIPAQLITGQLPLSRPTDVSFDVEYQIKTFLANIGWQEIYTYSMVSRELAEQSLFSLKKHLKLQNPLTDDRVYLRRSLAPSLIEALNHNPDRIDLGVFEVAHTYQPQANQLPIEELRLGLAARRSARQVLGSIEAILNQFYVDHIQATNQVVLTDKSIKVDLFATSNQTNLQQKVTKVGYLAIQPNQIVTAELIISHILQVIKTHPTYQPLPKTAIITEDLTFTLPANQPVGSVLITLCQVSPIIRLIEVKDIYQRNVTFTLQYHDPAQNLSTLDITPIRLQVIKVANHQHQAKLVGQVEEK